MFFFFFCKFYFWVYACLLYTSLSEHIKLHTRWLTAVGMFRNVYLVPSVHDYFLQRVAWYLSEHIKLYTRVLTAVGMFRNVYLVPSVHDYFLQMTAQSDLSFKNNENNREENTGLTSNLLFSLFLRSNYGLSHLSLHWRRSKQSCSVSPLASIASSTSIFPERFGLPFFLLEGGDYSKTFLGH